MTGFGSAETAREAWSLRAEARSVNHRDLKVTFRLPEAFRSREAELQKLVEGRVRRGHLYLSLACEPLAGRGEVMVDRDRIRGYLAELRRLAESEGVPFQVELSALLTLPGVLRDITSDQELLEDLWPAATEAIGGALDDLVQMREREGANLADQLRALCGAIGSLSDSVEKAQEGLVAAYRDRLRQRVAKLLEGTDVELEEGALAREVAIYADRCDVSEEIARLRSHLDQFADCLEAGDEPVGRKMEFLGQEMLREVGTISAKIPPGPHVQQALELRSEVDRLREQVRNVE